MPRLSDDKWMLELALLVDQTTYLNELTAKHEGKVKIPSDMYSDVGAFEMKLKSLHNHINEKNLYHFPFCRIALESFVKPFERLMLKNKFVTVIYQLGNEFLQGSLIFTLAPLKSMCSKILLL
jgi:hypothetical protein